MAQRFAHAPPGAVAHHGVAYSLAADDACAHAVQVIVGSPQRAQRMMGRPTRGKDSIEVFLASKAVGPAKQRLNDGETHAALGAARGEHVAAVLGGHPLEEAMLSLARDALGLVGPFHNRSSIPA